MTEPKLEVPAELRDLAEKTIDQAEKAFGMFFDAAGKSMTSMPGAGTEISRQALSFTEQNMKAAFEHARKLAMRPTFRKRCGSSLNSCAASSPTPGNICVRLPAASYRPPKLRKASSETAH